MAPELELQQTPKMDVWSLFMTLAYALNDDGFQHKPLQSSGLRIKAAQDTANTSGLNPLQPMAAVDPAERAAAGDMLEKLFSGDGRITKRRTEQLPTGQRGGLTPGGAE